MSELHREPPVETAPPPQNRMAALLWSWGWAIAAIALAVVSWLNWSATNRLERQLDEARGALGHALHNLDEEHKWVRVTAAPQAQKVTLAVTREGDPALVGSATYDANTQRAVLVFEHVAAPDGKAYELWAIRDGKPVSLGLIQADEEGRALVRLEGLGAAGSVSAFEVSLEPVGGSPTHAAPTGPVVMVGRIAR